MLRQQNKRYSIKSVEKALIILEALGEEEGDVSISHLSRKVGIEKSYVFRVLATFEQKGYVERSRNPGNYRVGLSAYETGQKLLSRMTLLRKARPIMDAVVRECNESLYLVVPAGKDVLMLGLVETTQQVKIISLLGKRYPLSCNAAGEIIQSFALEREGGDARGTSTHSKEGLDAVRKRGFSADIGGLGDGVASLAAPLLDEQKKILGCLCFVGPQFRFTDQKVHRDLLPRLKTAAQTISAQLGYIGHLNGITSSSPSVRDMTGIKPGRTNPLI